MRSLIVKERGSRSAVPSLVTARRRDADSTARDTPDALGRRERQPATTQRCDPTPKQKSPESFRSIRAFGGKPCTGYTMFSEILGCDATGGRSIPCARLACMAMGEAISAYGSANSANRGFEPACREQSWRQSCANAKPRVPAGATALQTSAFAARVAQAAIWCCWAVFMIERLGA